MQDSIFIIIPAKDESKRIGQVIDQTFKFGFKNIVVIDDGSTDDTLDVAKNHKAQVISHPINMGPGAATQTGIEYAINQGAKTIITIDGDQQHHPSDIVLLVAELENKNLDVVFGSRFLGKNIIPNSRILYNKIANLVTFTVTGVWLSDSQTGLKAFTAEFAKKSKLKRNGFEFCIEIINNIKRHNATFSEVPISVVYTEETMKKGQSFWNGVKMLIRIFRM